MSLSIDEITKLLNKYDKDNFCFVIEGHNQGGETVYEPIEAERWYFSDENEITIQFREI